MLVSHGPGYELRVAPGDLDLDRFEALVADGRRAMQRGDARRAGAILREALALWRGPPLADFAYEPFAQTEIARMEERQLVALEERIDVDLARGEHSNLVGELEALIEAHPHRERLRASLMLCLYRSGRQTEALQVYQDTRRELVDQVGVETGPVLRRLERQILEQDPTLDLPRSARPVARRRPRRRSGRILIVAGAGLILAAAMTAVIISTGGHRSAGIVTGAGDSLVAIDPATNRVVAEVPVGHEPTGVTIGGGAAWVLSADDQTI